MAKENLSLVNVCGGTLEEQFQAVYPQILQSLKVGKGKATVSMKIEFKRPEGTSAMAQARATFDVKMPPAEPRVEAYPFNADSFTIQAEVQSALEGEQNVLPFRAVNN